MPPHNIFDDESGCESGTRRMSHLFNTLISSSINTLTPMCNDSAISTPMCNDNDISGEEDLRTTYPMNGQADDLDRSTKASNVSKTLDSRRRPVSLSVATAPDPRRPPLNPTKPKSTCSTTSYRNRKKVGLSINVPPVTTSDVHTIPPPDHDDPPPLISCSRNVELRRKSLSERHFFRPVSEDEESRASSLNMGAKQ